MVLFMVSFNILLLVLVIVAIVEVREGAVAMWHNGGIDRVLLLLLNIVALPALAFSYYMMWTITLSLL